MDTKKKHIKELDEGTLDNLHTVQEAFKDINENIFTKEEIIEELQKIIDKLGG